VPGLRESKPWTSDDVLDLDFLPESVIVLGGGVVACELAQMLVRFGSRVTQIQRSAHILKGLDSEAVALTEAAMRADGVELFTSTTLRRVSFDAGEFTVVFDHDGKEISGRARHLVNALGREPDVGTLDLDAAGIELLPDGHIRTDHYQQTTNPHVYAAGDCAGPHEIVHVAIQQAEVAVKHAFGQKVAPMNYDTLLQVVFTDPPIATVGATRQQLERSGTPFVAGSHPFWDHGKSILMEAKFGRIQVLADPATGRLLGADIVGRDAGELIHVFAVALSAGLTVADLLRAPWYHPTLAEALTYPLEEIADKMAGTHIAARPM
jgi:pyruvate/2-oxoglutarate dehydrogenase complex dihydrolipoamide dehydrogenase (E3) component